MQQYYVNPIKKKGDFADPFVLRYNGKYYLYCTNPDIRCWSSDDLISWQLEGPVIPSGLFGDLVPFAPEVVYWNGHFYMYTSPSGHGHYVLKSTSPLGPFEKASENIGHSIDGSVFIDDDGQWYFYWAGDEGIWACKMDSPTSFAEPVLTGAFMNGWTEGPFVIKQNGRYYMTLTGNHYLSKGYRINAAYSDLPMTGFCDDEENPVIVRTQGNVVGLGHSSTVLGPDLKNYYIVYHNLNPDETRDLNIDRIGWHKEKTMVFGPTVTPQPLPPAADFTCFNNSTNNGGCWEIISGSLRENGNFLVSNEQALLCVSDFTADKDAVVEFNFAAEEKMDKGSEYGVIFAWKNEKEYYSLRFSMGRQTAELIHNNQGGEETLLEFPLLARHKHSVLHSVRLSCNGKLITVFIDNLKAGEAVLKNYSGGRLGYYASNGRLRLGFTGASNGNISSEQIFNEWRQFNKSGVESSKLNSGKTFIKDEFKTAPYEKRVFENTGGENLYIEGNINILPLGKNGSSGIIFRASQLANGGEGNDPVSGINFFIGYYVGLGSEGLVLSRHRYNEEILCRVKHSLDASAIYHVAIAVEGGTISVFLDNSEAPVIEYKDSKLLPPGNTGIRSKNCHGAYSNISIECKGVNHQ